MTREIERAVSRSAPEYPMFPFQPAWQTHWNHLQLAELVWWVSVLEKFLPEREPVSPW
jgi:hypothetical protein